MIEHLLVSTVVLALAIVAARFLPLSARTRYAVLLAGMAKFAVPTAVFRFVPIEVVPSPLRVFAANAAVAPQQTSEIEWLPLIWAAMAMLLFARWALLRTRTIAAALRSATPASQREVDAVREARITMNVSVAIDVVRSPVCEAPAVLRIVRPVIALPSTGCEHLSDEELRSLVLHECAHVARHDNLAALAQAIATSLLWFHPLVWIASRAITTTREQACDEKVADAMHGTEAYLDALTKICRAIAAPRTAGASCMAGANLKERMAHLMSYDTNRRKLWRHRIALTVSALLIAMCTVAVASEDTAKKNDGPYTGEPISINLRNADVKDVMETFAQLTGLDVAVNRSVEGTLITFECQGMPWDQALYEIAAKHGLVITLDGKLIRVSKK